MLSLTDKADKSVIRFRQDGMPVVLFNLTDNIYYSPVVIGLHTQGVKTSSYFPKANLMVLADELIPQVTSQTQTVWPLSQGSNLKLLPEGKPYGYSPWV